MLERGMKYENEAGKRGNVKETGNVKKRLPGNARKRLEKKFKKERKEKLLKSKQKSF